MKELTEKQKQLLDFIQNFQKANGFSPSIKEMKIALCSKSTRGITIKLDALQREGFIHRDPNSRRAIHIKYFESIHADDKVMAPIYGEIKAGYDGYAEQVILDYYEISLSEAHGHRDVFLLKVVGHSMVKAGIFPGDLIIIAPQTHANNGDIVVVFEPNEETATLKRIRKMKDFIVLLPETDDPTILPRIVRDIHIQGKYIGKVLQR